MRFHHVALLFALGGCSTSSPGNAVDASADVAEDAPRDTGKDSPDLDAGVDAAEAAPGVGIVACGASDCTLPAQVCCPQPDGGGACFPRGAAPCTPLECDQPGDCAAGTTCCYQFQNNCGAVGSSCLPSCSAANTVGACLGLGDCQVCVSLTCAGLKLTTCGTDGICCH